MNPLLEPFHTPHETFPFPLITTAHIEEAILLGMEEEKRQVEDIVESTSSPTFSNTVAALQQTGKTLERATTLMYNMLSAETSSELEDLAQRMSPLLSEHSSDIMLNKKLFERIKHVYDDVKRNDSPEELDSEDIALLNDTYDGFLRSGANLNDADKEKLRNIKKEISRLSLQFSQNHIKETNDFKLHITNEEELDGLPDLQREQAAETAKEADADGWVITLHAPSYVPFMTYANNRELRKKLYIAYNTQCAHSNKHNNFEICRKLINLRMQLAQMFGYPTYAEYVLKKRMASNTEQVNKFLHQLISYYRTPAIKEVETVADFAKQTEGEYFELQPWDFSHYSHLLKLRDYNIDAEMLRPYLELSKVIDGVFGLATKLYGITFKENKEIPVYHPDVKAYEVSDCDGTLLAVLYADFFPREGKKSGAWMTNFKEQWIDADGHNSRPHVSVTMNFTKPTPTKPALLTLGELETFLHEFGHALHGMFASTRYSAQSGTNVYWDFVELPSQFMENYAIEKDFLLTFAKHYETGESIPVQLIERIRRARNFNIAYACMRQVSFGLLDMAYYTRQTPLEEDIRNYEKEAWKEAQLLPDVAETCMTVQFGHIMSGGYAAGYYSYKWAEVLDADAFGYFKERGIFSRKVASEFREKLLSKGGTHHPMELYIDFRSAKPTINALLTRNGITPQTELKTRSN